MTQRILQVCAWLFVLFLFVLLGGCAAHNAWATWNQPSARWFTDDPPLVGTCEGITTLQLYRAELPTVTAEPIEFFLFRLGRNPVVSVKISAEESLQAARDEISRRFPDKSARYGNPVLVRLVLDSESPLMWVIVTEISGNSRLPNAAIVLVHATFEYGTSAYVDELIYAASAVDPATCAFDTTAVVLSIVRAPVTVVFAGYVVLIVGFTGFARWLSRQSKGTV